MGLAITLPRQFSFIVLVASLSNLNTDAFHLIATTGLFTNRYLVQQLGDSNSKSIIVKNGCNKNARSQMRKRAGRIREDNTLFLSQNAAEPSFNDITTLPQYLEQQNIDQELSEVICQAAISCIEISHHLANLPITSFLNRDMNVESCKTNVQGETQKPMDVIANGIFINNLKNSVGALASEEEVDIILGVASSSNTTFSYEIAFDPLDGSSNLDVSVPTGSIFGIAPYVVDKPFSSPGRKLVAAGYAVYSSSLEFVISLTNGSDSFAAGFTLANQNLLQSCGINQESNVAARFVLSRPNMQCPRQGSYYSLNEGREPDWPEGLKRWVRDAKRGSLPSGQVYSSRYICSLCADVHRTLLKGGWAGNPRPHLRLLYEAAPLAHIAEACGGKGSDGVRNILDIVPIGLHDRTCVYIGSINDVKELEDYGDVQQSAKTYET